MSGFEYRVIWQREGSPGKRRRFYETLAAAERCVTTQETAHDDIAEWFTHDGVTDWGKVPKPLVFGPVIERRPVGIWAPYPGGSAASEEVGVQ